MINLLNDADVFIENYSTGTLQDLGLGYDDIKNHNPKIIYCAMTGYGDDGPKAFKGAYDNTIQAASGTVAQCSGAKPGVSFVDYAAGYSAAFAIAAALNVQCKCANSQRFCANVHCFRANLQGFGVNLQRFCVNFTICVHRVASRLPITRE